MNIKQKLIQQYLEKAKESIIDVDFMIKNGKNLFAVNRIYYGIFYALSALALYNDYSTSKHQQLIGWFNKEFIKNNLLDKKYGQIVIKSFEKRSKADYDIWINFNDSEVNELFIEMKDFIDKIESLIVL